MEIAGKVLVTFIASLLFSLTTFYSVADKANNNDTMAKIKVLSAIFTTVSYIGVIASTVWWIWS